MKTYRDVGNDGQLKTCERSRFYLAATDTTECTPHIKKWIQTDIA